MPKVRAKHVDRCHTRVIMENGVAGVSDVGNNSVRELSARLKLKVSIQCRGRRARWRLRATKAREFIHKNRVVRREVAIHTKQGRAS